MFRPFLHVLRDHNDHARNDEGDGDEVENSKPAPEIFLKACQKLKVSHQEALVLEDSEAGIQAAYLAHIPVVCVPDMKYPQSVYQQKTLCIVSSLEKIKDIFTLNK